MSKERYTIVSVGEVGVKLTKHTRETKRKTKTEMFPSIEDALKSKENDLRLAKIGSLATWFVAAPAFVLALYNQATYFMESAADNPDNLSKAVAGYLVTLIGMYANAEFSDSYNDTQEDIALINKKIASVNSSIVK